MILIIDCGSSKTYKFKEIAEKLGFPSEIIKKDDFAPEMLDKYEKIIISGGPALLTKDKNYYRSFDFIKNYNKPLLGVCLGHQIIGLQFGADIFTQPHITGMNEISFCKLDKIFTNISPKTEFMEDHREYINLPPNFFLLGNSENCANEAMKHNNKPIYGVQFHPEISGSQGEKLLENFLRI